MANRQQPSDGPYNPFVPEMVRKHYDPDSAAGRMRLEELRELMHPVEPERRSSYYEPTTTAASGELLEPAKPIEPPVPRMAADEIEELDDVHHYSSYLPDSVGTKIASDMLGYLAADGRVPEALAENWPSPY